MKKKILSAVKLYSFIILYCITVFFLYSFYLMKYNKENVIIEIIIGISIFFIIGLCYGNFIHKKGLIVGIISGSIHIFLIKLIYFMSVGDINMNWIVILIYILSSGIGGLIGIMFKKII